MELYLMRHGIAEEGKPGAPDAARRLTPEGTTRTAAMLRLARRTGVRPDLILSSPYVRAAQTADIAREELGVETGIVHIPALVPHGTPESVWRELRDYSEYQSLMLTGHEPLLGFLTGYLLGAPSLRVEVKKAAIVRIDIESPGPVPRGVLRWMMVPAMVV